MRGEVILEVELVVVEECWRYWDGRLSLVCFLLALAVRVVYDRLVVVSPEALTRADLRVQAVVLVNNLPVKQYQLIYMIASQVEEEGGEREKDGG